MKRSESSVLFVSRENACRSLMAEACLRHLGQSKFRVFSCGVPALADGQASQWALMALRTAGIPNDDLHCKGWAKFLRNGAPRMDFVIALDAETAPLHPVWPGQPETALWAFDPLIGTRSGSTNMGIATLQTLYSLRRRIELLVSLHSRGVSAAELRHDLRDMAHL